MNWENFERIGLVLSLIAFAVLGLFSWRQQSVSVQLLDRLSAMENRLNTVSNSLLSINNQQSAINNLPCDEDCVRRLVNEAVATVSGISQPAKKEVVERVVEKVQTVSSGPKTQYVTLGGGDTSSTSWTDISGAEVSFDVADFGQIKQIFFEVSLFSPSGKVLARLWDKRAGTVVSGSEASHIAGDAQVKSASVLIPSGGRTIILQLKSEVGQPVKANTSRLRIDTK